MSLNNRTWFKHIRVISHLYGAYRSNLWDVESHFQVVKSFGWVSWATHQPNKETKNSNTWIVKYWCFGLVCLGRPRRQIELIMWDSEIHYGTDCTFNLVPCSHLKQMNQEELTLTFKRQASNSLIGQFWRIIRTQMGQSNCSALTDSNLFSISMLLMCIFMLFGDLKSSLTGKTEYKHY